MDHHAGGWRMLQVGDGHVPRPCGEGWEPAPGLARQGPALHTGSTQGSDVWQQSWGGRRQGDLGLTKGTERSLRGCG